MDKVVRTSTNSETQIKQDFSYYHLSPVICLMMYHFFVPRCKGDYLYLCTNFYNMPFVRRNSSKVNLSGSDACAPRFVAVKAPAAAPQTTA